MSDEPGRGRDLAVLRVAGAAVCCGLPFLLALGSGVTLAGVGLQSWLLVIAGTIAAGAGVIVWRHRRGSVCDPRQQA